MSSPDIKCVIAGASGYAGATAAAFALQESVNNIAVQGIGGAGVDSIGPAPPVLPAAAERLLCNQTILVCVHKAKLFPQ